MADPDPDKLGPSTVKPKLSKYENMQCFTELTPPTAVRNAICFPFLGPGINTLVIARLTLLQIYTFKTIQEEQDIDIQDAGAAAHTGRITDRRMLDDDDLGLSFLGIDAPVQRSERRNVTKLVLVAEYPLWGMVSDLARVKIQHTLTGGEALLVATRDAKMTLVQWDPERHTIRTRSLHYYEQEHLQRDPFAPELHQCVTYLTVDPGSQCAAFFFGGGNLALLPFKQPGEETVTGGDHDAVPDEDKMDVTPAQPANGNASEEEEQPYKPSFVLPLTTLEPNLVHPIHIAFLHEYREPTLGVLASTTSTSTARLSQKRDVVNYNVFTLDLDERASTLIVLVTGLPYDISRIMPLPPPVGGALLIGMNQLVHVDQAGRNHAVAVNMFAQECSDFSMADQADLGLKLEGCMIEPMSSNTTDLLMVLNTGELAIVEFAMDGRTVSGIGVRRVTPENGGLVMKVSATCAAMLGRGKVFLGSEDGDSIVLGCSRPSNQQRRKSRVVENDTLDDDSDDDMEDDDDQDDLYASADGNAMHAIAATSPEGPVKIRTNDYNFRVHDSLYSIAPINDMTFGSAEDASDPSAVPDTLQLVLATGRGRGGAVTILSRELDPDVIEKMDIPDAQGVWSIRAKRPVAKKLALQPPSKATSQLNQDYGTDQEYDRMMIVSNANKDGSEWSTIYAVTSTGLEEMTETEFDPAAGGTIEVGVLCNDTRVIQVLQSEVRSYDGDLGLVQILPMFDESTGNEPKILSASILDPYGLLIRDDLSMCLVQCDTDGDLEEVELSDSMRTGQWMSGCLYQDRYGRFGEINKEDNTASDIRLFLISADAAFQIYDIQHLETPLYKLPYIGLLPMQLSPDMPVKRGRVAALTDVLVADLGDSVSKQPYLMLRTETDEVALYEPFHSDAHRKIPNSPSTLRFRKIPLPMFSGGDEMDQDPRVLSMRVISDLGGYATVFLPGSQPCFLMKSAATSPKMIRLRGKAVKGMTSLHTKTCEKGCAYIDDKGVLRLARFPDKIRPCELGWPMHKIPLNEEVRQVDYYTPMHCYVLGTNTKIDFELPKDDELHRDWAKEDISLKPSVDTGFIKLLSPVNWTIIDTFELPKYHIPLTISTLKLCTSEHQPDERELLIAVGVGNGAPIADLPSTGSIYIFRVIPVVPYPDRPETDRRLKLIAKEDVKGGPVTCISSIGTEGFLIAAQGAKCMVRGLKEDGSLLPVAFLDALCFTTTLKTLPGTAPGTGFWLVGDAIKGVWFGGYMEEPYKMIRFSKTTGRLQILAADFFPIGDQLFFVIADVDCNLHVLQFDPEHPKSLRGSHLIHLRSFHTGHFPTGIKRIPSSFNNPSSATNSTSPMLGSPVDPPSTDNPQQGQKQPQNVTQTDQLLITSLTGSLSILTHLPEPSYRRLHSIATQVINHTEIHCSLNAKAHRFGVGDFASRVDGSGSGSGGVGAGGMSGPGVGGPAMHAGKAMPAAIVERAVLDGKLTARWMECDLLKRKDLLNRVGIREADFRKEMSALGVADGGGGVLGYL